MCEFYIAWQGKCKQPKVDLKPYCVKHLDTKCKVCKQQATCECDNTSGLVCGAPLCGSTFCVYKHRIGHIVADYHPSTYTLSNKFLDSAIADFKSQSKDFTYKQLDDLICLPVNIAKEQKLVSEKFELISDEEHENWVIEQLSLWQANALEHYKVK